VLMVLRGLLMWDGNVSRLLPPNGAAGKPVCAPGRRLPSAAVARRGGHPPGPPQRCAGPVPQGGPALGPIRPSRQAARQAAPSGRLALAHRLIVCGKRRSVFPLAPDSIEAPGAAAGKDEIEEDEAIDRC
jgi:hypothetical protein